MKTAIEMAGEAGICTWLKPPEDVTERLERFAELVREETNARANASWTLMCEKMVAIEREAIDQLVNDDKDLSDNDAIRISKAIRARGNK